MVAPSIEAAVPRWGSLSSAGCSSSAMRYFERRDRNVVEDRLTRGKESTSCCDHMTVVASHGVRRLAALALSGNMRQRADLPRAWRRSEAWVVSA